MDQKIEIWESLLISIKTEIKNVKSIDIKDNIYLVIIYLRILDLSEEIIIAVKQKMDNTLPLLFRTIMETQVDFQNLINDSEYKYFLEYSSVNERLKLLRAFKTNPTNPFFSQIDKLNINKELDELTILLDTLKAKCKKIYKIKDRFENAEGSIIYDSIYNILCQDTHNSISTLVEKYLIASNQNVFFDFNNKKKEIDYFPYIDANIRLLVKTTIDINNTFSIFSTEFMQNIIKSNNLLENH